MAHQTWSEFTDTVARRDLYHLPEPKPPTDPPAPPPLPDDSMECIRQWLRGNLDAYDATEILEHVEPCIEAERADEGQREFNAALRTAAAVVDGLFGQNFWRELEAAGRRWSRGDRYLAEKLGGHAAALASHVAALKELLRPIKR